LKTLTLILLPNRYKTQTSAIREDRIVDTFGIASEKNKRNLSIPAAEAIKQQAKELDIAVEVRDGNKPLPKVTTDSVIIVDEKLYLPNSYLEKAVALSTLFPLATLCGPINNNSSQKKPDWFVEDILKIYKSYSIDMYNCSVLNITNDENYWPRLNNLIIPQKNFNDAGGYQSINNPKLGKVYKNGKLVNSLSKVGDIVYSDAIRAKYVFNDEEFTHNAMCLYFYEAGYLDAIIHDDTERIVWEKYVNNSERFDYSMPVWVAMNENIKDEQKKKEYAKKLVVFKTLYNLGFCEAIEGGAII